MGLNFLAVPTVEGLSSIVPYSLRSRWRSPGDGHTATLGENRNGSIAWSYAAADAELPQVDGHSMTVISDFIAHAGGAEPQSSISHARHLLS